VLNFLTHTEWATGLQAPEYHSVHSVAVAVTCDNNWGYISHYIKGGRVMAGSRVPRPVRKLIDRASLIAAVLVGLLAVWGGGQSLLAVAVFAVATVFAYGACQYLALRLLGSKSRRAPRR
jgi:hypothetical protein